MSETDDELRELRSRILLDFQVQRGTTAWAPWGASGWSAVEVHNPRRKGARAQVKRIKPATGEQSGKRLGKVSKDRLLKRDPKLKGKDRPTSSPEEVFAHMEKAEPESKPEPKPEPKVEEPRPERTEEDERDAFERVKRLLELFPDDSTADDW